MRAAVHRSLVCVANEILTVARGKRCASRINEKGEKKRAENYVRRMVGDKDDARGPEGNGNCHFNDQIFIAARFQSLRFRLRATQNRRSSRSHCDETNIVNNSLHRMSTVSQDLARFLATMHMSDAYHNIALINNSR